MYANDVCTKLIDISNNMSYVCNYTLNCRAILDPYNNIIKYTSNV